MITITALAEQVWTHRLAEQPYLRLRRGMPLTSLRVESEQAWSRDAKFAAGALGELARLTPRDEDEVLTAGFLEHVLGHWVERTDHPLLGFTVMPYQSFFLGIAPIRAFAGYLDQPGVYLDLLADARDQVCDLRERLGRQREAGILIPRAALPRLRAGLSSTRVAVDSLATGTPSALADSATVLVDELAASYGALLASLDEGYETDAPLAVGMARYEGGEDAYRGLVRQHTGTAMSPEQLHELGLQQVAELTEQLAQRRAQLGFNGTEREFHLQLAEDPRLRAASPAEVEARFLGHMARLDAVVGQWFSALPRAPYGVARMDPANEAGMTFGFYEPPSATQELGRFRWNGANLDGATLLTSAALIFHELAPGHHFHLARQAENKSLPDIRRFGIDIGAFNEGWAEYASGLGWEMGLYEDPRDAYGRLVHERFTAQRLVLDTGLNLTGWSLEHAFSYARKYSVESDDHIRAELLRYSTDIPAQALAYRAGYLEFNRIRTEAEKSLKHRFDIRNFHEQLLAPGALPFPVLDAHIKRWTSNQASAPPAGVVMHPNLRARQ